MCVWITRASADSCGGGGGWRQARQLLNDSEVSLFKKKKKTLSGGVRWGLIESEDSVSQTISQFKLIEGIHGE